MVTFLTGRDYDHLRNELRQKEAKLQELHLKMGEAANSTSSFVDTDPGYMAVKSQIETLGSLISSIKDLLSKVDVKELDELDKKTVTNYSLVTVEDQDGEEHRYYIQIPFIELRNKQNTITASPESPVGKALLGAKIGQKISLNLPHNNRVLKIKEIQKI